jgi:hypothetical protein
VRQGGVSVSPGARRRALRVVAAGVSGFAALVAWTPATGPVARATVGGDCALSRTRGHHSGGTAGWKPGCQCPGRVLDAVMLFLPFPTSGPC